MRRCRIAGSYYSVRVKVNDCPMCNTASMYFDKSNKTSDSRWVCPDCGQAWVSPDEWRKGPNGIRVAWAPEGHLALQGEPPTI